MADLQANLESIRQKISKFGEVKLVAITKTVPLELIEQAIQAGIVDIGENRVQEAQSKIPILKQKYPQVKFHLVGHLQTNKVNKALELFDLIQSVDSEDLAAAIDKRAQKLIPILIEVKTSAEATKYGVPPEEAIELIKKISSLKNLQIQGLMTMAPYLDEPEKARPYFRKAKKLFEEIRLLNIPGVEMKYLSMGMSNDYKVALEEGANLIRIGSAIFKSSAASTA